VGFRHSEDGASPLTVITVFVGVAVLLTVGIYALFFDNPAPDVEVIQVDEGGNPAFEVASTAGGLEWEDLDVRLIDRAGADRGAFLDVPAGAVSAGDRILFRVLPPAGSYLLLISAGEAELTRLTLQI
jgi:hypothetical protein